MSSLIFPTLSGLTFPVKRTQTWSTRIQETISGKRTFISDWSFPRWSWELTYSVLRQAGVSQQSSSFMGQTYNEWRTLAGFFAARAGRGDSFLYLEPDDNASPVDQIIGTGDGNNISFQLVSDFTVGGFSMPILAPQAVQNVKVNGIVANPLADYDWTDWSGIYRSGLFNSASPDPVGSVTFVNPPNVGDVITWTGIYYFPVQFDEDSMNFDKFMSALFDAKSVKFSSLK